MRWLTLNEWDQQNYAKPHAASTLRKWAKNGYLKPAAQKHGREWLVREDAVYCQPDRRTINRLRQAKAMTDDTINPAELDHRVLEILSDGSQAA